MILKRQQAILHFSQLLDKYMLTNSFISRIKEVGYKDFESYANLRPVSYLFSHVFDPFSKNEVERTARFEWKMISRSNGYDTNKNNYDNASAYNPYIDYDFVMDEPDEDEEPMEEEGN